VSRDNNQSLSCQQRWECESCCLPIIGEGDILLVRDRANRQVFVPACLTVWQGGLCCDFEVEGRQ
jgi:hypothetical protein